MNLRGSKRKKAGKKEKFGRNVTIELPRPKKIYRKSETINELEENIKKAEQEVKNTSKQLKRIPEEEWDPMEWKRLQRKIKERKEKIELWEKEIESARKRGKGKRTVLRSVGTAEGLGIVKKQMEKRKEEKRKGN